MDEQQRERSEEQQHLLELRNILRHRKMLYELQKARTRPNTAPDVLIGLVETEQELRLVESKLRAPRISANVLEAVGTDGLFLDIARRFDELTAAFGTLITRVDTIEETTTAGALWREDATKRMEQEAHDRKRGQRRNFQLLVAAVVLVALVFGLLLYVFR